MSELLLELYSEEIPARMQADAAEALARLAAERLAAAELAPHGIRAFVTPQRLTLIAEGVPARQPDRRIERRGPRVGAPEQALQGFLRGLEGAAGVMLEERETAKGRFHFAVLEQAGRPTAEVLLDVLPEVLAALPWPKSMRWNGYAIRWVRPLHRILCVFDGAPVPLRFGHLVGGAVTSGHRFLAPEPFVTRDAGDYERKLRRAYVLIDREERRRLIAERARELAAAEGLRLVEDAPLLEELAGMAEWPVPLLGSIDPASMKLPPEVLTTTMRAHQRYLSLQDREGRLAPRFVLVANIVPAEGGAAAIVAGNERVLRARLWDARFFWDSDRKVPLADRVPGLAGVVFHARLGTLRDKVERLERLSEELRTFVPGADQGAVRRAAHLCKADLLTGMVGEFPELQGVMGRYYALHDGEAPAVADAIAEHYAPQGPNDRCPTAPVSVTVALADKIDTLVGFFSINEAPTGSRDPFGLRRAALGVIRIVLENGLRLPLRPAFEAAYDRYVWRDPAAAPAREPREPVVAQLLAFFADRLKVELRERGVRHDLISAVFAAGAEDDLVRLLARVQALGDFLASEDGANLLVGYRRAANIVRIEEKKDGRSYAGEPDPALFRQPEERQLDARLAEAEEAVAEAAAREDYAAVMAALARLRAPVDAFFDRVTVNADEPELRANRLRLLSRIRALPRSVADFSRVEEQVA